MHQCFIRFPPDNMRRAGLESRAPVVLAGVDYGLGWGLVCVRSADSRAALSKVTVKAKWTDTECAVCFTLFIIAVS